VALLLAGGGTFAGRYVGQGTAPQASATVNDLKILDNNATALQQMDQLLDDQAPASDDSTAPPTT
jgi:hypothetical protein